MTLTVREQLGHPHPRPLTAIDLATLDAMARGGSRKDAAALLGVTENTVRHRLTAVYRRLGIAGDGKALTAVLLVRDRQEHMRCPACGIALALTAAP